MLDLKGGSMCQLEVASDAIKKFYVGDVSRGHEKIEHEALWFRLVPHMLNSGDTKLFPHTVLEVNEAGMRETSLLIEMIPGITISKAIIRNEIEPNHAVASYQRAQKLLFDFIYPQRSQISHASVFADFHAPRMVWAQQAFLENPTTRALFELPELVVNGRQLPPLSRFVEWACQPQHQEYLHNKILYAIHGNLHFDNIIVNDMSAVESKGHITFIDPRGDLCGPLHYDSGKLMGTVHSHYDEIHYDKYELSFVDGEYRIEVDRSFEAVYCQLLGAVNAELPQYAAMSAMDRQNFERATAICEAIHVYSFAAYHLRRSNPDLKRVTAYLLIAALLREKVEKSNFGSDGTYYSSRLLSNQSAGR